MAFDFISIERIARKSEHEPHGYNAEIQYGRKKISFKIYTEAFLSNIKNILIICNRFNYQPLDGDFRFRIEMPYQFKNLEKEVEQKLLDIQKSEQSENQKFKKRFLRD